LNQSSGNGIASSKQHLHQLKKNKAQMESLKQEDWISDNIEEEEKDAHSDSKGE